MRKSWCLWLENLPVQDASSTFVTSLADINLKKSMDGWDTLWGMVARARSKFEMQGWKITIIDNCPAHPEVSALKAINLQFLPPNTTSCIQQIDQAGNQICSLYYFLILLTKRITIECLDFAVEGLHCLKNSLITKIEA